MRQMSRFVPRVVLIALAVSGALLASACSAPDDIMRLLFLILLLCNALAFGFIRFDEGRSGADNQLMMLQIAPEKMVLRKPTINHKAPVAKIQHKKHS